jgi:phage antirepressor YoqD-like protein
MEELVFKQTTMSSREIAELTGKEHKNVLADCDKLNETYSGMGMAGILAMKYLAENGQYYREYLLTRMQCFDLMTGYNTELRIKVNRRWEELETKKQIDFSDPDTVLMLAQNWKEERQKRLEAEKQVSILKPKADFMNKVMDCDQKIDIGQDAKILGLPFGRNTLFIRLREKGIFFKNRNEPKQEYIERGHFELKEKWIDREHHDGFMVVKVLVTQRGLDFLAKLFEVVPKRRELAPII